MNYSVVREDGVGAVTVIHDGDIYNATSDHPNWLAILRACVADNEGVVDLFNIADTIAKRFDSLTERLTVRNDRIYFDGDEIENSLTETILRFLDEDREDWVPLANFFEKVMTNPQEHSREQLFDWLRDRRFTLTSEGNIVMYKGIKEDYKSVHGGKATVDGIEYNGRIPNTVGSIVEMPRSEVAHDPSSACSAGLHAADFAYADHWGPVVISLIVDPRDVVSVPTHDNSNKVRVCRYLVRSVVHGPTDRVLLDEDNEDDWDF